MSGVGWWSWEGIECVNNTWLRLLILQYLIQCKKLWNAMQHASKKYVGNQDFYIHLKYFDIMRIRLYEMINDLLFYMILIFKCKFSIIHIKRHIINYIKPILIEIRFENAQDEGPLKYSNILDLSKCYILRVKGS